LGDTLSTHDTLRAFLSGFLASIVYVVFQLLLPTILERTPLSFLFCVLYVLC
jgi:hypothetical protein